MSDEFHRLAKNTIWMVVGNFASKILVFFLVPFYTHILSTEQYGTADLIATTVSLITPIFTLLVSESILRFALDYNNDKKQVFSISLTIFIIGTLLLCALSPVFTLFNATSPYILELIIYFFFNNLCIVVQQYAKGLEEIRKFVVSGVLYTVSLIGLNVLFLVVFGFRIRGYLNAISLASAITVLYLFCSLKLWKSVIDFRQLDKGLAKKMIKYSLPLVPNSISWWVSNSSDKYMLTSMSGTSVMGVYSISYKIPSLMNVFSGIFTSAWQISAVKNFGSEESRVFFSDIYKKSSSLYIFLTSIVIVFIKPISKVMFSNEFYVAWKYASILIIAALFQSMCSFLGSIYTTAMKTRAIFWTTLVGAGSNVLMNILLIPPFGAYGAAIATMSSYFIVWVIRLIHSRTILRLEIKLLKDIVCYFLLGGLCCIEILMDNTFQSWLYKSLILCVLIVSNRKELFSVFGEIIKIVTNKLVHNS